MKQNYNGADPQAGERRLKWRLYWKQPRQHCSSSGHEEHKEMQQPEKCKFRQLALSIGKGKSSQQVLRGDIGNQSGPM